MSDGNDDLVLLLRRVGSGDHAALRALYDRTSAKLFGIALRVTVGDRAAAEEVLQDSFVKIWRKAALYDPAKARAMTWLCAIARNTAIDWRRASGVLPQQLIDDDIASTNRDDAVDAVSELEQRSMGHHIRRCLRQLDAQQAQAVRTAFFEGLTHSELAARMAVPLGTLKSWIRRAMLTLRDCIDAGR